MRRLRVRLGLQLQQLRLQLQLQLQTAGATVLPGAAVLRDAGRGVRRGVFRRLKPAVFTACSAG